MPQQAGNGAYFMEMNNGIDRKRKAIMICIIIVCVMILCEVGYAIYQVLTEKQVTQQVDADWSDSEAATKEDVAEEGQIAEQETEEEIIPETVNADEWLKEGTLMICVPAESMFLRKKPGLDSATITELKAGDQVIWDGTRMQMNGTEFYRVAVRKTGRTGYVVANSCIQPDFLVDNLLEQLTVVQMDDALYSYEMMVQDIETLTEEYPDILTQRVIGKSLDGRNIYELILGNPDAQSHILAQGAIHGREYMTSQLLMKLIEYYAYYYDKGQYEGVGYQDLLQQVAIHIVPMANPDGVTISQMGVAGLQTEQYREIVKQCYERDKEYLIYEVDQDGNGNWRDYSSDSTFDREKFENQQIIDFEQYQKIWKANAEGVDLNNNFDAGWEELDLKENRSYGGYKGIKAVSEPETQALVELALEREYDYYISYHARGQLIYYDAKGNTQEASEKSRELAELLQNCLMYKPVNTQNSSSVNLGGFSDWVQLSLQRSSVTIESGKGICPLAIEELTGMWYRHRETWAKLMKEIYL